VVAQLARKPVIALRERPDMCAGLGHAGRRLSERRREWFVGHVANYRESPTCAARNFVASS
jgi:hypothetical protein